MGHVSFRSIVKTSLVLLAFGALLSPCHATSPITRVVYLGIDRIRWDYYPFNAANRSLNAGPTADHCTALSFAVDQLLFVGDGRPLSDDDPFIPSSVYDKLVFRAYSDRTFTRRLRRPPAERHLGLLGPLVRVAAGEVLEVVVRGLKGAEVRDGEDDTFSLEIGGLSGEGGAGTVVVRPEEVVTYRFHVTYRMVPSSRAHVDSQMLLYRGVVGAGEDGSAGVYKGLLGPVVVYRRGALDGSGMPIGVGRELVTVMWVGNENVGDEEGDEEESNLMHAINGFVYCALPGLDMTEGEVTRWYFGAVGNEVDVHTAHVHGIVGTSAGGEHTDSLRLLPGATAVLETVPDNVGVWLLHCHVADHIKAGMQALFTVHKSPHSPPHEAAVARARHRVYYVQAEDVVWDYAPRGAQLCEGRPYGDDELIFVQEGFPIQLGEEHGGGVGFGLGSKYLKTRYVQYTDATYSKRVLRDESMEHLGLMGPVLRARVGEVIVVQFRNRASVNVSVHPHGVLYTKAHEGAPYNDGTEGPDRDDDVIVPGESYVYRWEVPDRAGPGPGERQDVKLWMYHSHRSEVTDTYAGLFGALVIVGNGSQYDEETLLPADGTREVFLHMSVMNEGGSFHLERNAVRNEGNRKLSEEQLEGLLESEEFEESNLMHAINGYLYCNGPLLKLRQGQPTRFYFYALGTEVDLHTPMIGNEVLRLDVHSNRGSGTLLAGSFSSALVTPRHTGLQEIRCNVNDHVVAGMRMLYYVQPDPSAATGPLIPNITHYIAAEEIDWDYTPLGKDGCTGRPFGEEEKVFTEAGPTTPGSRYMKAVYREYTDSTFTAKKRPNDTFAGVVGPLLHFEVGEVVKIVFRNRLTFAVNINFVGLDLVSSSAADLEVLPGAEETYMYRVRAEAGPSKTDRSAVAYVYYSSVDPITHTAAGLTGVIGVVKRGGLRKPARLPKDTEVVQPLLFQIFRENESPLMGKSLSKYALEKVSDEELEALGEDEDWLESNTIHSVNGYLYGNNAALNGLKGSSIRFYVFGYGSEASMHSPAFKGQVMRREGRLGNAANGVQILPFNAETVDVLLVARGLWPIVCGVSDHVLGGMKACLRVR